jgi:hypothetical protein
MKKLFYSFLLILIGSINLSIAQPCPGDVYVLEDNNIETWKVAQNGSIIFSLGAFQGTVNVGGSTYTQPVDNGGYGLLVYAHDITGSFLWAQQIISQGIFATSPTLMTNGITVVVGFTEVQGIGTDQFLRFEAYNASAGSPAWSKSYPVAVSQSNLPFGAQVMPYDGKASGIGNYIVSGAFAGTMNLNGTILNTSGGNSESFVMALDVNGVDLWAVQSTGSNGRGRAWTLDINFSDEIIIGGHYTSSVNFGGILYTATSNTIINPYLAKLKMADGTAQWVVGMENGTANGTNNIYDIASDDAGNVYYAGNFNDNITILSDTLTSAGTTDALIGALDTNGGFLWANQLGGVGTSDEFATTLVYSLNANSIFVGTELATESVSYGNINMLLPPTHGHYVIGVNTDGTIELNTANAISKEDSFGYSVAYDDQTNSMIFADLIKGNGKNINIALWIPNRPRPFADVTPVDGILNPSELLTAFDPGGIYTYQWYYNGALLPSETLSTYTAALNGNYYVAVTNSNSCAVNSKNFLLLDGSTLESDSLVLVDLYNSTNGAGWMNKTNWLVGNVSTWFGVSVNGGRVNDVNLNNNNLSGNFPQSIVNLSGLQYLGLYGNPNLAGQVPNGIWSLTNLIYFDINSATNLTFEITADIQNLTQLETISAGSTNVIGTLPLEIGNVTTLLDLDLGNVTGGGLSGTVPAQIGNLPNLTNLNLSGSNLTGTFPDAIWQIPTLKSINIGNNPKLEVVLPTNLASLTQFADIRIDLTKPIGGVFPSAFYGLTNLVGLSLRRVTSLKGYLMPECQIGHNSITSIYGEINWKVFFLLKFRLLPI